MSSSLYALIRESPPGEVNEVVKDLQALGLDNQVEIERNILAYHEQNNSIVTLKLEDGMTHACVLSSHCKLPDNRYYDQVQQKSFSVSVDDMTASDIEAYSEKPEIDEKILTQLKAVVQKHYLSGPAYSVFVDETAPKVLHIVLVASKYNPNNFWNGSWRLNATYSIEEKTLKGSVYARVHYYEDGNVWLDSTKDFSSTVENDSGLEQALEKVENEAQKSINSQLAGLNNGMFKTLRRQLPVTRQRINWENVNSMRMANA
ncbi:F-actin capping protein alpha subunit [Schizosaccharomyces japonicus yFS275]|uniref:F-actin-capping protein subunit alpha n=1 Tax=Schizosaccharomyces japonicus (strain yFS275 / FY16936) TaxID=402676 RepID=B6JZ69_SCHJY|nr:F-actin capping protein alpha subunit [Schizosaccharomyces japonicus yFS275]EEB06837.1 F-actin capping protein alpha subunit [Schizosaccharomyces japonicus yFS275]